MNFDLNKDLKELGYSLKDPKLSDYERFYLIKKENCIEYVMRFFGNWEEDKQQELNYKIFQESLKQDYFKKLLLNEEIIGFLSYTVFEKEIGCVTLQVLNHENKELIYKWYLNSLIKLSNEIQKPIYMKVFIDNEDLQIYKEFGFEIFNTNNSHHLMIRKYKE